ncbi:MAG: PQQ-binding-like beta-propeller repeat protein, partial [Phycisphaeraceae bacterium]
MAARLDARDGMIEWLRSYERATDDVAWAGYPRRRGGRPHVVGDTLVFAPRDNAVVLALDASSGRLLWQRNEAGGDWIVGVHEERLLTAGRSRLSALAVTSGQTQWVHELEEPLRDVSWIDGRPIAVSTGSCVEALDPGTGESLGTLATAGAAEALAPTTGGLVAVTHEPDGVKQIEGVELLADAVAGRRWGLVRSSPELVAASKSGRVLVRSGTMLECLDPSAKEPVRWQRFITADLSDAVVTGETVLLAFHDRVLALDLDTGRHRWEVDVPFEQVQGSSTPRPQWHLKLMPHQNHVLVVFESVPWQDYPAMMVQIDEGKVLWALDAVGDAWGRFMASGVVWEGDQLFLLANANQRGSMVVPVDILDGTLGEPERFHPDDQPFIDTSLAVDG